MHGLNLINFILSEIEKYFHQVVTTRRVNVINPIVLTFSYACSLASDEKYIYLFNIFYIYFVLGGTMHLQLFLQTYLLVTATVVTTLHDS